MSQPKLRLIPFTEEEFERAANLSDGDYRRGYAHGYGQALDDVRRLQRLGYSRPQEVMNVLWSFADRALRLWRCRRDKQFLPPQPVFPERWQTLRDLVFERDGHACVFCNSQVALECDHIVPVAEGGLPNIENLRALCVSCHRTRSRE